MEKSPDEELQKVDGYYNDSISKLDFGESENFNREWVNIFLPHFEESLRSMINGMGYLGLKLHQVWYQQYHQGSGHGWHIHAYHFTGVYYLEFPKGSAATEICSPYNLRPKKFKAKEGDIIIFPSHWIHRAPANTSERKTIISFNFEIDIEKISLKRINR